MLPEPVFRRPSVLERLAYWQLLNQRSVSCGLSIIKWQEYFIILYYFNQDIQYTAKISLVQVLSNPDRINEYYFYYTVGKTTQVAVLIGTVKWPWLKRISLPYFISPVNINGTKQTRSQLQISSRCQQACCWVAGAHKVDAGGCSSALDSNPHLLEIRHSLGFSPPACKWREWQQYHSVHWLVSEMCSSDCPTASSSWNWRDQKPNLNCPLTATDRTCWEQGLMMNIF